VAARDARTALARAGPPEQLEAPRDAVASAGAGGSSWRLIAGTFSRSPLAITGLSVVVLITAFCFAGPHFYHTNQITVQLSLASLPPGRGHPLGTDALGYDILGRLMVGGQSSLELGVAVSIASSVVGTLYGAVAGLAGGVVDAVMMRVVDTFLAIPSLVLLLICVNLFKPNLLVIILLLTLLSWLVTARLVRGETLTLRTREFVQAARMMGASGGRIVIRHLVPNVVGIIVANATLTVADAILTLAALSFLGLGLPPPHADWGNMLAHGLDNLFDGYWWQVYPAAIILIITVMAVNLIGEAIRDSLDVRLRRR
jgi:peptide/nickel transport system permease protein